MDPETFNRLILLLSDKTFRLAKSILKDAEKAKDAVQELNLKLWEKKSLLHKVDNMPAFIMRSMRNLCLDAVRKQKEEYLLNESMEYEGLNPYQEVENKDMLMRISSMIDSLPETQRSVIRLRDVEGMEISEIAYIMQLTENSVSVNLSRARKRIKEQILHEQIR